MKQLIIVSTVNEILPLVKTLGLNPDIPFSSITTIRDDLDLLITGVGIPSTSFCLTRTLAKQTFDRVIQIGVAGSYKRDIPLASLNEVGSDCFADLGIDDRGQFISLFESGLAELNQEPFINGRIINQDKGLTGLPLVDSITVNTVSGSRQIIEQRISGFNPDIETMEGASSFYVCKMMGVSVLQVRAISNFVEPRNRDAWELNMAINNLNNWLAEFINAEEGK